MCNIEDSRLMSEFYPESQGKDLKDFCLKKKISFINLKTRIGSPEIKKGTKLTEKVLLAINYVYFHHNLTLEYLFATLGLNEYHIDQLSRGVLVPNRNLIERLVAHYKINPTWLFDNSKNILV